MGIWVVILIILYNTDYHYHYPSRLGILLPMLPIIFCTKFISNVIDIFKYKKMTWEIKDLFFGILVLLFLMFALIIFIINYNIIGKVALGGFPPIYALTYYIEASMIPWLMFEIHTTIKIKEFKKKEKLSIRINKKLAK